MISKDLSAIMTELTLRSQKRYQKGALLIEVLLTMVVLAVGLTLIIQSFMTTLRATAYTADYSTATLLAEDKMYELVQPGKIKDSLSEENKFAEPYDKFKYHLTTKNLADGNEKGYLNEIDLLISWTAGQKDRSLHVVTYLPDEEL